MDAIKTARRNILNYISEMEPDQAGSEPNTLKALIQGLSALEKMHEGLLKRELFEDLHGLCFMLDNVIRQRTPNATKPNHAVALFEAFSPEIWEHRLLPNLNRIFDYLKNELGKSDDFIAFTKASLEAGSEQSAEVLRVLGVSNPVTAKPTPQQVAVPAPSPSSTPAYFTQVRDALQAFLAVHELGNHITTMILYNNYKPAGNFKNGLSEHFETLRDTLEVKLTSAASPEMDDKGKKFKTVQLDRLREFDALVSRFMDSALSLRSAAKAMHI